jgi:hypothetical protein
VHLDGKPSKGIVSAAIALSIACSSPPAGARGSVSAPRDDTTDARSAALGDTVHIQLGRSASVDGGRLVLTFRARGADSRCPANAVCVWMGDAAVTVAARAARMSVERELHTGLEPRSLTVDGYVVTVVGLLPYPGTTAPDAPPAAPIVLLQVARRP